MSPDDIDSLIVEVVAQLEDEMGVKPGEKSMFDDDDLYERLQEIFYHHLEKYCTRDRNYN
jgi:hypothetical protein